VTFKIATLAPDGTKWMKEIRSGGEEIKARTGGRVKFRFFPGGIMGNDKSVLRKIRVGQLHGGALTAGGLSDIAPDSQIYTLPLAFRSLDEVDYVRERMDAVILDELSQKGFVSFGLSEGGFAYLMSNRPLRKAGDLKGRKVWIPEGDRISRAGFEAVDVSPIPLSVADVLTGLQTGLIDTVGTSSTGAIALQWYTHVKYITEMPLLYLYGTMIIKQKTFEKLTPADRDVVRTVMAGITDRLNDQTRLDNQQAYDALRQQGIIFVDTAHEDRAVWEASMARAMDRLADEGVFSKGILRTLRKHVTDYRRTLANPEL
jgi:TRAP-type C4-dicarboxylate transport system substrate-binding protein